MPVAQAQLHQQSIRYLKGVGPVRMVQLQQLGIVTIEDALYYAPRRYEDRRCIKAIAKISPGELVTVRGSILTKGWRRTRRGQMMFELALRDHSGVLSAIWFRLPYFANSLEIGNELIAYGRIEPTHGSRVQMVHPEIERIEGEDELSLNPSTRTTAFGRGLAQDSAPRAIEKVPCFAVAKPRLFFASSKLRRSTEELRRGEPQACPVGLHMGRIVPVYPLTSGLTQRWVRTLVMSVLDRFSGQLIDSLPDSLVQSYGWLSLSSAVHELHFPSSWENLEQARKRLVFEELFWLQLILAQRRATTMSRSKPQRYLCEGPLTQGLRERLAFSLTTAQQEVLKEILDDLKQPYPMHRLLQGEVGCGKTIVVVYLMAAIVQSGYQVALMAPTELLAEQHVQVINHYLGPLGVRVGLLSQGVTVLKRKELLQAVAQGRVSIVVGTHALIQHDVVFDRLSLVVIDEQHKFGVGQRIHLAKKAQDPDVLVITATPIPRTLALSIYGDLAISTITQLPPGRRAVKTLWLRGHQRQELYALIHRELKQGRQGYVVYPLVEPATSSQGLEESLFDSETSTFQTGTTSLANPVRGTATGGLKAATQMAKHLQGVFPEFKVGLLHGQMKSRDKEQIMNAFGKGELSLLVSTVIVEVGLDIPNATIMVIEHPERFGLAQLHQLRGRIGRGMHPAICVLISDVMETPAAWRLRAFVETTDGFQLAEEDLKQRGPGQLFGRDQHGFWHLRLADLLKDRDLLELSRKEATAIIQQDPKLVLPQHRALCERLKQFRERHIVPPQVTPSVGK